jgi:tetratricopeptide (TPR) repeat protein
MELVRGVRITDYCDQRKLAMRERLELFVQVCQAVQHAHQKGIIHRDLKPSNILVTRLDGVAVPKVIDFGIAKATQQPLTQKTLFTAFQQFVGTPAYMSPEQAELSGMDVDTRSDIYSLGVLLYELVTGHTPFETSTIKRAGFDELRRLIREQEPPRPSTRLRALPPEDLTTVARRQRTEAPRLIYLVRGDLDWIVMKCLEKDRARRYETASGLAHDVQRHLNNEPVTAAGPGTWYRMRKFARRHRFGLVVAALVTGIVVAGVVVGLAQADRAVKAERDAARAKAELQEMGNKQVLEQLRIAHEQETNNLVLLNAAKLEKTRAEQALKDTEAAGDEAKTARAKAEQERDNADQARAEAVAARQETTLAMTTVTNALRESQEQQARLEDAMNFLLYTLSDKIQSIGHVELLRDVTTNVLAYYRSLALAGKSGQSPAGRLLVFQNFGDVLAIQGESARAEAAYRESLAIAETLSAERPGETNWQKDRFHCHKGIGETLEARGESAQALEEFENSLAIAQSMAAPAFADPGWRERLLHSQLKVGDARRALGDRPGAREAYKAARDTARGLTGTDTNNAAWQLDLSLCAGKLGSLWLEEGQSDQAMGPCQNSLQIARQFAAKDVANSQWQSALADSLENMGNVLLARKQTKEALKHYEEALQIRRWLAANDASDTRWRRDLLRSQFNIARAQASEGKGVKRLKAFLTAWKTVVNVTRMPVDVGRQFFVPEDTGGNALEAVQKTLSEARQLAEKDPGNVRWKEDLANDHSTMGDLLLGARKPADALSEYRAALEIRQQLASRDTNAVSLQYALALAHANVAATLRRLERPADALAEARLTLDLLAERASCWPGNFVLTEGPGVREGNLRYKLRLGPDQQEDFRATFSQGFDEVKAATSADVKNPAVREQWGTYCAEKAVFALFYSDVAEAADSSRRAVEVWQRLGEAAPANTTYRTQLLRSYLALGAFQILNRQPHKTVEAARSALQLDPTRAEADAFLVLGHLAAGQYDKARTILMEHKDLKVGPKRTFAAAVLEDLRRLKDKGVATPDAGKIEQRLAEEFPAASE